MSFQVAASPILSTTVVSDFDGAYAGYSCASIVSPATFYSQEISVCDLEALVVRSFIGMPVSPSVEHVSRLTTSVSDAAPFVIGRNRAAEALIQELSRFRGLRAGWDGEGAVAPNDDAVCDAVRFVAAAGQVPGLASRLEPTLNADGTVSLEFDDQIQGTLMFKGDDTIVYVLSGTRADVVEFMDEEIPHEVLALLRG